jgi:hypothetical protein
MALVAATVGAGVMGLARSLTWSYEAFLVMEFLDPVFSSGMYTAGFILGMTPSSLKEYSLFDTQMAQNRNT